MYGLEIMKVLSLFDGISCARVAFERVGIPVTYYSCEIDKNAIRVSNKNYPDIVRLGDVRRVAGFPVDLLIGGSPCNDLSIGKQERKGLEGEKSSLFWEFVRILKECKPKWFVLENVASMSSKDRDIITAELGVLPVMIDASLVSAQCRKRLFWSNIQFEMPVDRGITISDVIGEEGIGCSIRGRKVGDSYVNKIEFRKDSKVSALTSSMHSKLALVSVKYGIRNLTPVECERLQGLPDEYTSGIANSQRYKVLGNAFNVDVVGCILRGIRSSEL